MSADYVGRDHPFPSLIHPGIVRLSPLFRHGSVVHFKRLWLGLPHFKLYMSTVLRTMRRGT